MVVDKNYMAGYRQALEDLSAEIGEGLFDMPNGKDVVEALEAYIADTLDAMDNPE